MSKQAGRGGGELRQHKAQQEWQLTLKSHAFWITKEELPIRMFCGGGRYNPFWRLYGHLWCNVIGFIDLCISFMGGGIGYGRL